MFGLFKQSLDADDIAKLLGAIKGQSFKLNETIKVSVNPDCSIMVTVSSPANDSHISSMLYRDEITKFFQGK